MITPVDPRGALKEAMVAALRDAGHPRGIAAQIADNWLVRAALLPAAAFPPVTETTEPDPEFVMGVWMNREGTETPEEPTNG